MSYACFILMLATSAVVMFALMYLNAHHIDHVVFSQTRAWMAILMGSAMAIIMLLFMWRMYEDKTTNVAILLIASVAFAGSLSLVRTQISVDEVAYMKAMIPHHSIAIMTSERARISDPRVRRLAQEIRDAQVREIAEMKALIADLEDDRR
jgi:hypothetical protein